MDPTILHTLANICKEYYVLRSIDTLYLSAGAKSNWRVEQHVITTTSERLDRFFSWSEGVNKYAGINSDVIMEKVARAVISNTDVPEHERERIQNLLTKAEQAKEGIQIEPLLSTLARALAKKGLTREVAIVTFAQPQLEWVDSDRMFNLHIYRLFLKIPFHLYSQIEQNLAECTRIIYEHINALLVSVRTEDISEVVIASTFIEDDTWREKALAWLTGQGINNQGRVRSNNIASRSTDGLLFRSNEEINLYKALKSLGVSFAPLPVFVRGGDSYRRIEPDFVILKDGVVLIIEVDGDTFHRESPSEAHDRITMLTYEGAHIERINAKECNTPENANKCAKKILSTISKLKDARR